MNKPLLKSIVSLAVSISVLCLTGCSSVSDEDTEPVQQEQAKTKTVYTLASEKESLSGVTTQYSGIVLSKEGNVLEGKRGTSYKFSREYDTQGNLVKEIRDIPGNEVDQVFEYTYDEHGNKTSEHEVGTRDVMFEYSNDYNSNGQLIRQTTINTEINERVSESTYTYDAGGLCVEEIERGMKDSVYRITYEYDVHGNKTKETVVDLSDDSAWTKEYTYTAKEIPL